MTEKRSKRERRAWFSVWVFAPLGFLAAGLALTAVSSFADGQYVPALIAAGAALLLAYWLGRKSRADNTAVAVAAAVADATATAAADARAAAVSNVAVVLGRDPSQVDPGAEFAWLSGESHEGIASIPESAGSSEGVSRVESRRDAERVARSALDAPKGETRVEESIRSHPKPLFPTHTAQ